jgi:hypothetical protein
VEDLRPPLRRVPRAGPLGHQGIEDVEAQVSSRTASAGVELREERVGRRDRWA